jgi:hypothetical protein
MKWLKLYAEMIDDAKIRLLSFEDRWHYVALLCCKAEGIQDEVDGLWEELLRVKLGLAQAEFDTLKKRLLKVSLIDESWNPKGWEKRQAAKDPLAAERQRKYREKQKKRNVTNNVTHNVTATSQVEEEVEEELEEEKEKDLLAKKKKIPPSLADVSAYCQERNNGIDAQHFLDYYESRGWISGKTKIKCWKSCVRTWERNAKSAKGAKTFEVDYL